MVNISGKLVLWSGYIFSLFAAVLFGFDFAFNVYAIAFKETFNLTQTQVEIVASTTAFGMSMGSLEFVLTFLFGYKFTCVCIVLSSSITSGLFVLACNYQDFFHDWPSLLYINHFVLSSSNCIGYVAVSRVCIDAFSKEHTGKLIGIYLAAICAGKAFFAVLFDLILNQSFEKFFFAMSISYIVILCPTYALLGKLSTNSVIGKNIQREEKDEEECCLLEQKDIITIKDIFRSPFFHITFWFSTLLYGSGYGAVNNITVVGDSLGLNDPIVSVYVLTATIVVVRVGFGVIFDFFRSNLSGFTLLLISYVSFVAGMLIGMCWLNKQTLVVVTILIGGGMAPGLTIPISILVLEFGQKHYSLIVGVFYFMSGVFETIVQLTTGFFYDSHLKDLGIGGNKCYGPSCFYWYFLIMLVMAIIISIVPLGNILYFLRKRKKSEDT